MKDSFKIGTRGSRLAITQTKQALALLAENFPAVNFEIIPIETKGDRLADHSLLSIGGQGAFVKEIEIQLMEGRVDFAVHSLKDLPTALPDALVIGSVLKRQNPFDCIVFKRELSLAGLPENAVVGTSSLRRKAQILRARSDLEIRPIRGNIDTRLRKLREEDYDAIVLAVAGLERLNIRNLYCEELSAEQCVPAIGQGALAIECRKEDLGTLEMLQSIEDQNTRLAVTAERAFLQSMDGSCTFPIGGFAVAESGKIRLTGMIGDAEGSKIIFEQIAGDDPVKLGQKLAGTMIEKGANQLIREFRNDER